jgi:hypothetical protein
MEVLRLIDKHYRDSALGKYGNRCEICSYGLVEVHHIDYNEQWIAEDKVRKGTMTITQAKKLGYDEFKNNQLSKNDDTKNLAVLCGNCHTLIHKLDSGKQLLNILPDRK